MADTLEAKQVFRMKESEKGYLAGKAKRAHMTPGAFCRHVTIVASQNPDILETILGKMIGKIRKTR